MINIQRATDTNRNISSLCTKNQFPEIYEFYCLIDKLNKEGMWLLDIGQAAERLNLNIYTW